MNETAQIKPIPESKQRIVNDNIVGQVDALVRPRFTGIATFARLPRREDVLKFDVAFVGVPFDAGVTYRPGARFGPAAVREGSRLLRSYNTQQDITPFNIIQVVDAGDIPCNPFNIKESLKIIEVYSQELIESSPGARIVSCGGDHTITLPLLRTINKKWGKPALIHFDAHLDTWDTYFGADYTHGTPLRRAAEEDLFDKDHSIHVGLRGPSYSEEDFAESTQMGFKAIHSMDFQKQGTPHIIERIKRRIGKVPLYISIDIDTLDPAHAPGTGTPEIGGITTRELQQVLHAFKDHFIVGADVVEVSPPYDHAELTSLAAANVCYELMCLMAHNKKNKQNAKL